MALPRGLQRDVGVEEALDDLQLDEVAVGVETLGAAAVRVTDRRAHEVGASPVVELPVGDTDDLADQRSAVPVIEIVLRHRAAPEPAGTPPPGAPG